MMKRTAKGFRTKLGFEKLEGRRLLAADFGCGLVETIDVAQPDQVVVASTEYAEVDQALEEALGENGNDSPIESVASPIEATTDPRNLDLSDSMDGFFGSVTADRPIESVNFTATGDGIANIVVASSFGESGVQLAVTQPDGSVIEMESNGESGFFDQLSFEVAEGENYQVSVTSTAPISEGQFQLTVGFEEFVDQHADEVGDNSTQLEWTENQTSLTGKLENPGDVDTFKTIAPATGEVTLALNELVDDSRINLDIEVFSSDGSLIADGATNEFLQLSFDVSESEEYFISIRAADGEKGDYQLALDLQPTETDDALTPVDAGDESESGLDDSIVQDETPIASNPAVEEDLTDELESNNPDSPPQEDVIDVIVETPVDEPIEDDLVEAVVEDEEPTTEFEDSLTGDETVDEIVDSIDQIEGAEAPIEDALNEVIEGVLNETIEDAFDETFEDVLDEAVEEIDNGFIDTVLDSGQPEGAIDLVEVPQEPELTEDETSIDESEPIVDLPLETPTNETDVELEAPVENQVDRIDESQIAEDAIVADQPETETPVIVIPIEEVPSGELDSALIDDSVKTSEEAIEGELAGTETVDQAEEDDRELMCDFGSESIDLFFSQLAESNESGLEFKSNSRFFNRLFRGNFGFFFRA